MSTLSFKNYIYDYQQQVSVLQQAVDKGVAWPDESAVLAMLRLRDHIQTILDYSSNKEGTEAVELSVDPQLLIVLSKSDAIVGNWQGRFFSLAALPRWRKTLNPPEHHWWWYPAEPAKPWREWLLGGLTIALLTVCLAIAKDILVRFSTGAPGIWSSIGAIAPAALALFATGGVLTKVGKQLVDKWLAGRSIHQRPVIRFWLALGLAGLFLLLHVKGIPWAASRYHAVGERQYFKERKVLSAQANFQRALQLNPDFPLANHNLALTYEDLGDFDRAKAEYAKAMNGGWIRSVNNFARLKIMEEDFQGAAVVLLGALDDGARDPEDARLEYSLRKNLGWAWLEQGRLVAAEGELVRANRLEEKIERPRPDSHCLLARVYEAQGRGGEAQGEWKTCRENLGRPEDDVWAAMADEAFSSDMEDGE